MNVHQSAGQVAHQCAGDLLSTEPIAMVTSTSAKQAASSKTVIETSGMPIMLNVGFTLWFRASASKSTTQAWKPPQRRPCNQLRNQLRQVYPQRRPCNQPYQQPPHQRPLRQWHLPLCHSISQGIRSRQCLRAGSRQADPCPFFKAEATVEQLQAMATSPSHG